MCCNNNCVLWFLFPLLLLSFQFCSGKSVQELEGDRKDRYHQVLPIGFVGNHWDVST